MNYARSNIGANEVPLSYIIWGNDDTNMGGDFSDLINKMILCAPLKGEY